ncbi:hypothetical protein [Sinorhizobium saheli]|uniref:hypothetical protein n=1 Tax=Sinorhizobium saheli TaxID=36856 RepID=UPI000B0C0EEC|nr:hypothetical protein [Sinorhizobium saheli]MQW88325.1 hypothetical protein [Sinorhizobium saheli]
MNARMLIETYHSLRHGFDPFKGSDVVTTYAEVDDVYIGGIITTSERDAEISVA